MRSIPDPGFAGDDGAAPDAVAEALATYDSDPDRWHARTLMVLQRARLLVPVIAMLAGPAPDPALGEKTSDMATVLTQGRDGRTALLAFTSIASMSRWDPEARPVPVAAGTAAAAALQDRAAAMVVDVAGPVMFVIDEADLRPLAEGYTLTEVGGRYGWVKPG